MPDWRLRLMGHERDLRFLSNYLNDPDWQLLDEEGEFYLCSSRPGAFADAGEVKRAADEIIDDANLTAPLRFEPYNGVQTAGVVRIGPDGAHHTTLFAAGFAAGEATIFGSVSVLGSPRTPLPAFLRDAAVLRRRTALRKALRHVREEPGWFGYWKAAEALGEDIGGLKHVHALLGWASKDQFERFEKTVHHHRHHTVPAPPNPMSESEAKAFIIGLLRRCFEWNREGRPPGAKQEPSG
jgi:hypothetical protein